MKNKSILKLGLYLFLGLTALVFSSCSKDDDEDDLSYSTITEIKATNVKIENYPITTVKATVSNKNYYNTMISESDYINEGFTLKLPESVDSEYLSLLSRWVGKRSIVSDIEAKISNLNIVCYNEDNREICVIEYAYYNNEDEYNVIYMYSDRDVFVNGEIVRGDDGDGIEEIDRYNLKLKKGWNVVYTYFTIKRKSGLDSYIYSLTNKKPSGIDFSWKIEHLYDYVHF